MQLFKKVKNTIDRFDMIKDGDKVIVGFSGGPDSVFLTTMLIKMQEFIKFSIILVHINHMLRGEDADADENFCYEFSKKHNLKLYAKREDIKKYAKENKMGLEQAGRNVRYQYYRDIMEKEKGSKMALGHNLDDSIETTLFNLIRGCGITGLTGISPKNDNIIRPIINIYKKDIVKYLDTHNIAYCIDKTNFENDYTRNKIRLDLIPYIEKEFNPQFRGKMANLIDEMQDMVDFMNVELTRYSHKQELNIDEIKYFPKNIKNRIIFRFLLINTSASVVPVDITREKIKNIEKLIETSGSASIDLSYKYILVKEYNILKVKMRKRDICKGERILPIPGEIYFGDYVITAQIVKNIRENSREVFYTNLKTGDKLIVRTRRPGDEIMPKGMKNNKKIKDIFINEKVPRFHRDNIPLITYNDEIVWAVQLRGSEKYKYKEDDNKNKEIIKLTARRIFNWTKIKSI